MQLQHLATIMPPEERMNKVTAVAFAPNNRRVAVVTIDRVVHLFDEAGEKKDKFITKPANKVAVGGGGRALFGRWLFVECFFQTCPDEEARCGCLLLFGWSVCLFFCSF